MLLSACIIAKDEAERLPACLASLAGVADEIVVYDTGSTDATMDLARQAGAVTVAGWWPGGFADARNAALEHCRGEWVLAIDADEELCCADPGSLRRHLARTPSAVHALQVPIDNVTGAGTTSGYSHVADRVLRRGWCRWRGRLHEQLVSVGTGSFPPVATLDGTRIRHSGYLHHDGQSAARIERNLRLARAEVDDPSLGDRGIALVWLGRALWAADRPEEALHSLLDGARTTANPAARRQGLESAARIALRLDRPETAGPVISELRRASTRPVVADLLDAGRWLALGRPGQALRLIEATGATTGTVTDDDGRAYGPPQVLDWWAAALAGAGQPGRAVDAIVDSWAAAGRLDADLDLLVHAAEQAMRPLDGIAARIPDADLTPTVAAALRLPPGPADRLMDALWRVHAGRPPTAVTVLAGAAVLARGLPCGDAVKWASRLRHHDLPSLCPLRVLATDLAVPPRIRAEAARLLAATFGEHLPGPGPAQPPQVTWKHAPGRAPELSVILLAAGGAEQVLACLESLSATLPADLSFEVVAVDPGTTDATGPLLSSLQGDVAVVTADPATGPAAAWNLGLQTASAPVAALVEPATRFAAGWAGAVLQAFRSHPHMGAAGPVVEDPAGEVVHAGLHVRIGAVPAGPAAGLGHRPWRPAEESVMVEAVRSAHAAGDARVVPVDALLGPVVVVRASAVQQVGGFDEGYWGGGETADLCLALRAGGSMVACLPGVGVVSAQSPDVATAAWTRAPAAALGPGGEAGPIWQYRENRDRFTRKWGEGALLDGPGGQAGQA